MKNLSAKNDGGIQDSNVSLKKQYWHIYELRDWHHEQILGRLGTNSEKKCTQSQIPHADLIFSS